LCANHWKYLKNPHAKAQSISPNHAVPLPPSNITEEAGLSDHDYRPSIKGATLLGMFCEAALA
jgi:hypothetical protein